MARMSMTVVAAVAVLLAAAVAQAADSFISDVFPVGTNGDARRNLQRYGDPRTAGNKFVATLVGSSMQNNSFPAGQEVRMVVASAHAVNVSAPYERRISYLLRFGNYTLLPAFNATGPSAVRVRVIAAHSTRTATLGATVPCSAGATHDTWFEHWGMAPRRLAFGRHVLLSGFVTFTAPPFNFRFCVKDTQAANATRDGTPTDTGLNSGWAEFENQYEKYVKFNEPVIVWKTPSATTLEEGDFSAIEILGNAPMRPIVSSGAAPLNISAFSLVDSVKLVPFGYPCTYEKEDSSTEHLVSTMTTGKGQYCGANAVQASTGLWLNSNCGTEGAVAGGVARVGARTINPFATTSTVGAAQESSWTATRTDRSHLVAYFKLPAAGQYDVCVSSRWWRRTAFQMSQMTPGQEGGYARNAMPVWIKAYDASSSLCDSVRGYDTSIEGVSSCQPRKTAVVVTAPANVVSFATIDDTPGSWGEIKFTASSGTLNYGAATQWDHSSTRDYYNLTGGDMFRLVPEQYFGATPAKTSGDLGMTTKIVTAQTFTSKTYTSVTAASATYSNSGLLSTTGTGKYTQYAVGVPDSGTMDEIESGSGCFWQGSDNFGATGHFGNPGTQCCSSAPCTTAKWCTMTDSGVAGPTASADLGANPRIGYQPWALDGTASTAYGYIRFPMAGTYRVCYKQAGSSSWKVLKGTQAQRTTSNATFVPKALNSGFTYHFNDSRGDTWGPVAITSLSGNTLDKQAWNYYTASSATAVGSALKIVKTTESCYVSTAQSRTFSMNPGSKEMVNTLGSADDATTLTSMVNFFVKVPSYSTSLKYRICFRQADKNWHALADPNFAAHQYMTTSTEFGAFPSSTISFTLADTQTGSWGKFIFNRSTTTTPSFNADSMNGDMFRLVPNVTTSGEEVNCDRVWDASSTLSATTQMRQVAQKYDAAMADGNLGLVCAVQSSVSTDPCYTGNTMPTSNSVVATTPYTDIIPGATVTGLRNLDATVGFVTVPTGLLSTTPVGYKVCYKNARFTNWVEATNANGGNVMTVMAARTVTAAAPTGVTLMSGQYSYVALTATAAYPINIKYDLVKLVPFAQTCENAVATNAGYELYTAISGVNTNQCVVDATNSSQITSSCQTDITSTTARAYMTMPTVRNTAGGTMAQYRVCYMARTSTVSTQNWHDLSGATAFTVKHHGITYTAMNKPYYNGQLRLRIASTSQLLDTRSAKDSTKLVLANVVCADSTSTDQPATVTAASVHKGREVGWVAAGVTDVAPTDVQEAREAQLDTVLWSSVGSSYKVCYKPFGMGWVEVLQADGSDRVVGLASDYIMPTTAEVSSFTASSSIRAQFTDQPNYHGQAWTSVAVGGASGYDGTTHYFYVTYAATQTAGLSHKVKFVESYREEPAGTYTATGMNCFSEGIEHTYTTTATTTGLPGINMPLNGAKYTVCVWVAASSTWYQAPSSGGVSQPMTVVASKMGFSAASTTGVVTVTDAHSANGTSFGGLAGGDYVYIINATGSVAACGSVGDFAGVAVATAKMNLSTSLHGSDSSNFLAVRMATLTLPTTPRTGSYAVCVQRTQQAASNASGFTPFVKTGWFHVANIGAASTGGGSPFLAVTGASKLNISGCPTFNTTYKLRTGRTFDVTVRAEDASHNVINYALNTKRYAIAAVGTGYSLQSANGECSAANAATYGYTSSALTQYMDNGRLKFSLTALSACPAGGCTLSFTAPGASPAITATSACTFDVQPTTVAAVSFVTTAASCSMGSWCSFKVVAVHSDGGVAHTINSGVAITTSGWTSTSGTGRTASGATFSLGGGSLNFVNGVAEFSAWFQPTAYSTTASETVTFVASANGKTSPAVSFTVYRPILSAVHIVDVYPVATTGAPLPALLPTWEPTQSSSPYVMRGGDAIVMGSNTVSAATGYHMVAGQAYEVVFRAVVTTNGVTSYATMGNIVPSGFGIALDSTFVTTLAASNNQILRGVSSSESNTSPLGTTSWGQGETMKTVSMRFHKSGGCTNGCTVPFTFAGMSALTASLTTPVRSVATKLVVVGCATSLTALASSTASTCTGVASTVNKGWYINVSAVDDFGNVDRFFDGDVVAVMPAAAEMAAMRMGIKLSTVSWLAAGSAQSGAVKVTAVKGFATFHGLTVTKPCASGCELQLMSTWGADVAAAGSLVATPNTVRLTAQLNTALAYCTATSTSECLGVAGVSLANTTNAMSLVYKDTRVCMNVKAVDANGDATLYETNWIGYYARDVTVGSAAQALTVTDDMSNTGFVQRYKPLKNSMATFCFTVSGFTSPRDVAVSFVAQRFGTAATYWSHGSTGMATVGTLKVWPAKLVASVLLSGATGGDVVSGGVSGVVSASYTGTAVPLTLAFTLKDHYNNSIIPAEVTTSERTKYLHFRTSTNGLKVTNMGSTMLRGDANVTLGAVSVNVTSTTLSAAVTLSMPCLGCMITADLVDQATLTHQSALTLASPTTAAYLGSNVTMYVVNQAATVARRLAFNPSTSPLTSYWVNASAAPTTTTSNTAPTYGMTSCFAWAQSCNPLPAALNLASCDARGTTMLGSAATSSLKMRVYIMPTATALTTSSMEPSDATSQVDIMNTYTVSISFGNQLLSCATTYGAACGNDLTAAPTQTLMAYGSTVRGAIGQFAGVADASIRSTSFYAMGLSTSSYLLVNSSTSKYDAVPSVGGAFSASATGGSVTVSGLSMAAGNAFYWRPADAPATISLLASALDQDACNASTTFACSGGAGCSTAGLAQSGLVSTGLAFAYASHTIPVGVAFPMTVEAHTAAAQRAVGASGTVTVTVDSWAGCNNGGAPTFTGTMANGRATIMVTFASACEGCVLKFAVTPSGSQAGMWAAMTAVPALLETVSSAITVTAAAQAAVEVVATSAVPASALTSTATMLTVATPVAVTLTPRAKVGNIPFATTASTTMVTLSPRVQTSGANWWWVGNGGVLRPSLTSMNLFQHYQVTTAAMTSETTMSAYFTRTCASCMITVSYKIGSGSAMSFNLPSTFVVTTAASMTTLVGFVPRSVKAGQDVAIALWSTGSEAADSIPVAGVAPATTVATAATPSVSVTVSTNGDGGRVTSTAWVFNTTQIHRMSFSAPCDTCTVSVGGNAFPVRVFTTATHLRPGPDATLTTEQIALGVRRAPTMVALDDWRIVPVQALDDAGFVDQSAGMSGCEFPARRFVCTWAPVYPSIALTADGMSTAFPVTGNADFFMGDQSGVRVGYNRMVAGMVNYNYSFTTPQRAVVPVFSATIGSTAVTSALSAMRAFPVPKYSVSVGTSNLAISVASATPVGSLTQNRANTFHVALVGTVSTITGKKFVAVEADNQVMVSASAGCPAHTVNASGAALMAGYATFSVTFAAATDATTACELTFTAGAGTGSCAAAADCVSVQTVTVATLVAQAFDIVRPTAWEFFDGTVSGTMQAHAGRALKLRTAVSGRDATGTYVPVTTCTTCSLTVTSSDCGFTSATSTVEAGGAWAEVSLTMADNGAATYTCSITVAMTGPSSAGTSTSLLAMDRSSTSLTYSVTVCKSASVKLLTNTSEVYRGMMLRTGAAYEFYAVMMTAAGTQCLGDSQDDGTVLELSAVNGATGAAVPTLAAVNVNASSTTTAAAAMGNMAAAARTSVTAVGGGFKFHVVFTNSTVNLNLTGGVKVRIAAAALSSVVMSGAVDTVVAASRLAFGRMMFPSHIVKTRVVPTMHMGMNRSTAVSVMAVDGLPASWQELGLMSGMPNVAMGATDFGNDARVMWSVAPAPPRTAAFPLSVGGAAASTTLAMGRAMWSSVTWNGEDGIYGLSVVAEPMGIAATPAVMVTAQTVRNIALDTRGFTMNPPSAPTCTSAACVLPNGTFTTRQNATVNGGVAFLSVDSLSTFNVSVMVTDGAQPVLGDHDSVIAVTLNSNAGTSVVMGKPPLYQERGTVYARVRNGRATFDLGFLGDTMMAGGVEQFASMTFSCPATRPAHLLMPGESPANPCTLSTTVGTQSFQVVDVRARASVLNSAAVIAVRSVIKAGLGLTTFQQFNASLFGQTLVSALQTRGVSYLFAGNIGRVLLSTSCTTETAVFPAGGDLGATVCGANQLCASPNNLGSCPRGVTGCACPQVAPRSLLLSRFLLQNTTTSNGTKTNLELSFELHRAETFPARTADDVAAEYTRVQSATLDAMANDPALVSGFQIESVSERLATAVVTTLPPATTQAPPPVVPQPPSVPVTTVASESAASPLAAALALVVAALVAIFA